MSSSPAVLAVIPARGGSKGVAAKNLAPVAGVPLVARAARECLAARNITDVVVSTDDPAIAEAARSAGAEVVERPPALAGDLASSEAAVLHAMDQWEERHRTPLHTVLLVQCTSPFLVREDVERVAAAVIDDGADSALTVAPFHGFVWRAGEAPEPGDHQARPGGHQARPGGHQARPGGHQAWPGGHQARPGGEPAVSGGVPAAPGVPAVSGGHAGSAYGVNHDRAVRPRRQDRPEDLLETGAAYAMDAMGFREAGHRFFGRTAVVRTDPARVLEIDDPHDLDRARALAPLLDADRQGPGALPTREDIDAVVLDFDGTQTDDRVYVDSEGRETVAVHRGDGLGIAALRRAGLDVLILSTETNPVVAARAAKLRLPVLHGIDRKDLALKQWCEERGIAPERVLYAGNDANDLGCFALAGWPVAVADAHDAVRAAARAVTTRRGGAGAVREIAGWLVGAGLGGDTDRARGAHPQRNPRPNPAPTPAAS
ncbi:acylneuraminate cytidylyltransferase [Streptomyces tubbatahanensis]|uniref:N-acylneuraminate cytidylyltransferase n=1 Tax=Streptomyces tubbatahanensis TaxID=2923272 RepID=A0ABY3XW84_9ACTN|nr:acylneuraminate cytidylyltransferase [Streptomyces tubbatahanensis]UNS98600.1 acylneuraminate cytidylyltransferase [Streptomyces tubbatahanensis]